MKNLKAYVDQMNSWNAILGKKPLIIGEHNQQIADSIDSALSPENLTCDGELGARAIRERHLHLSLAAQELIDLDPTVTFFEYAE